jgi:hypothetical protein
MPWPLSKELRGKDKVQAVRLIRHLQTQYALQQLAMETYNDGLALAAGTIERGDEIFNRPKGLFQNPSLVAKYALPASEEKLAITEEMLSEHQAFDVSGLPKQALEVYSLATESLTVIIARARLQLTCLRDWVDNPSIDVYERMSSLDGAEEVTFLAAVSALNSLIQRAGLSGDPWLAICHEVFNDVRGRVGLSPLSATDFRARQLQGMAGGRARFFGAE